MFSSKKNLLIEDYDTRSDHMMIIDSNYNKTNETKQDNEDEDNYFINPNSRNGISKNSIYNDKEDIEKIKEIPNNFNSSEVHNIINIKSISSSQDEDLEVDMEEDLFK